MEIIYPVETRIGYADQGGDDCRDRAKSPRKRYSGEIRKWVRDYIDTKETRWVILDGDIQPSGLGIDLQRKMAYDKKL